MGREKPDIFSPEYIKQIEQQGVRPAITGLGEMADRILGDAVTQPTEPDTTEPQPSAEEKEQ